MIVEAKMPPQEDNDGSCAAPSRACPVAGMPSFFNLFREIGEIKTNLQSVLDNQKDIKDHMIKKFEKIDEDKEGLDKRLRSVENSRGVLVGISAFVSFLVAVVAAVAEWFHSK